MSLRCALALVLAWLTAVAGPLPRTPAQVGQAPGADPRGVVVDEQGRPLAGAAVSLQWEQGDVPFARAIAARLQHSPLPATVSGRDGAWVLPLTEVHRQLGTPGYFDRGCWLVVEKDGFHPWREPIPAGLPSYLGSRVLLRAVRAGDPFADLPWPPAIVTVRTGRGFLPWLAPGEWTVSTSRRGGASPETGAHAAPPASPVLPAPAAATAAAGSAPAAATAAAPASPPDRRATLVVQVTCADQPVPRAQLWFDDGAFVRPADAAPLPFAVAANGLAEVALPSGERALRVTAPGFLPREIAMQVASGERTRCVVELVAARAVDVVAVSETGAPVPFVWLDVVPVAPRPAAGNSFKQLTDASGRARLLLDDPAQWIVHGDRPAPGGGADVVQLGGRGAANEPVRVVKNRPVTVRLRGDRWPAQGHVYRERAGENWSRRAFRCDAVDAPWVVTRLCERELDVATFGGDLGVPIRIRATELPPAPAEPLLDLVALDRTVRERAELVLPAALGTVRRFVVGPPFQVEGALGAVDTMQCAQLRAGRWLLLARDDGPLELFARARDVAPLGFTVGPATGGELPRIELALRAK